MSECVTGAETVNGVPVKYRNGAMRREETLRGKSRRRKRRHPAGVSCRVLRNSPCSKRGTLPPRPLVARRITIHSRSRCVGVRDGSGNRAAGADANTLQDFPAGCCEIRLAARWSEQGVAKFALRRGGRSGEIRTRGLTVPNRTRYQTALHPEKIIKLFSTTTPRVFSVRVWWRVALTEGFAEGFAEHTFVLRPLSSRLFSRGRNQPYRNPNCATPRKGY